MKLSNVLPVALALSSSAVTVAAEGEAAWEWAGTFATSDSSHKWNAQKVGGSYVDPSMRIVFYSVSDPSDIDETIHKYEDQASDLIDSTDGSCVDVNSGGTIDPSSNACYTLVFDEASDDSSFTVNTDGMAGFVAFAQHVPIEFERDMHYLKDSSGNDVEPVLEEGADGHDHSHGHEHEHEHGASLGSCACAAAEYNFNIDCTAKAAMLDALASLKNMGCGSDCSSKACETAYLVVQSHHDYCPEDQVPEEIEDGFHDYDDECSACDIVRVATEGAPACPEPDCGDSSGNDAYASLVDGGCGGDCSSDACRNDFFVLRAVHDLCDHDTLSKASEEGLHDMEKSCATAICNLKGSDADQLACAETESGASTAAAFGAAALIGAVVIAIMV